MRNPHAADTLEGIARWRLLEGVVDHMVEDTRQAIEWLIARGFLEVRSTAHSPPIYSLNHETAAQVRALLRRGLDTGDPETGQ